MTGRCPGTLSWMDLSGAPVLLLPRALAPAWAGIYLAAAPDDELPDLELPDGTGWSIDATFDFDRPRTDYDRLCATVDDPCLVPVGDGHGVAFGRGHDRLAWCEEHREIVGGGTMPEHRDGLSWEHHFTWHNPGTDLLLMNACRHGADPRADDPECVPVRLAPGWYEVATAEATDPATLTLCRFRRASSLPPRPRRY